MNVVIAHHHIGAGGVTKVIANHVRALESAVQGPMKVGLIYDGDDSGWPEIPPLTNVELVRIPIPEVGYSDKESLDGVTSLARRIDAAIQDAGFGEPGRNGHKFGRTVLHVHNHALGKNVLFTAAVNELATRERAAVDEGVYGEHHWPMLLQCHDFAEDYRPANYAKLKRAFGERIGSIYPPSGTSKVQFAVLNRRDLAAFRDASIDNFSYTHLLPNPVAEPPPLPDKMPSRRKVASHIDLSEDSAYWLYPVRGIRRKNLGELCLLAAAGRGRVTTAVTLAPTNPKERPYFESWRRESSRLGLACRFGVGEVEGLSYAENLAAADALVTTSIAEGFGMVFLEAWLTGKPLVGRDLPDISGDFGLDLSGLYRRLGVPIDWVGRGAYFDALRRSAASLAAAYGRTAPSDAAIEESVERRTADGTIDFADLDEALQLRVVERVASSGDAADMVAVQVPGLSAPPAGPDVVAANAAVVKEQFSLRQTGERLLSLYDAVYERWQDIYGDPMPEETTLVEEFQALDRLRLIRS